MGDYIPLSMPALGTPANYAAQSAWDSQVVQNLTVSGDSFIQSLADLKKSDFFSVGDIPSFFDPIFYAGGLGRDAYVRPTRPDMTPPSIKALSDRLAALTLPTPPATAFTYADPGYSSALQNPLIAKLLGDLLNGGYGIDDTDETRLWNRARDREAALAQSNIDELKRQAAGTSFPMPQGALYLAIQKSRQDYMAKTSSVNRDIALKRADMYVEQRRRVIEQVIAVESQNQALYNAIQGRALEIARTQVQMAIALFEAGIRFFSLQIEAVMKQIEAQMEFSKTAAMVYSADIALYQVYVNALVADSQAFIQNQRNVLDRDKAKLFANVEQVKFRLEQLRLTVDNARQINQYGAEYFRTGLGAALSSQSGLAVQTTTV